MKALSMAPELAFVVRMNEMLDDEPLKAGMTITFRLPKPPKRGRKPRKPIRRSAVAKRSAKRSRVLSADAVWSKKVQARDGRKCVLCLGYSTDTHHWYGKKAHPALRYVVANGIALCRDHHDTVHAHPKFFKAGFETWYPARSARLAAMVRRGRRPASERP